MFELQTLTVFVLGMLAGLATAVALARRWLKRIVSNPEALAEFLRGMVSGLPSVWLTDRTGVSVEVTGAAIGEGLARAMNPSPKRYWDA